MLMRARHPVGQRVRRHRVSRHRRLARSRTPTQRMRPGKERDDRTRLARAHEFDVPVSIVVERFGETYITLRDPDNMAVELVASGPAGGHALSRFHAVTLTQGHLAPTAKILTELLNFTIVEERANRTRFASAGPGFVDVEVLPDQRRGSIGAGIVHHIAFRTPTDEAQQEWHSKISEAGLSVSPIMDRNYFHSIYFREPGGVLFEIATDRPGFSVDEPAGELGLHLKLPKWYEPRREELEAVLPALS